MKLAKVRKREQRLGSVIVKCRPLRNRSRGAIFLSNLCGLTKYTRVTDVTDLLNNSCCRGLYRCSVWTPLACTSTRSRVSRKYCSFPPCATAPPFVAAIFTKELEHRSRPHSQGFAHPSRKWIAPDSSIRLESVSVSILFDSNLLSLASWFVDPSDLIQSRH